MGSEVWLPSSQEPVLGPFPEFYQSTSASPTLILSAHLRTLL